MTNLNQKSGIPVKISIPVNEISSVNKVLTSFHHGDLEVDAIQNRNGDIDYNHINWQGVDLFHLLNNLTQAEDIMQMITGACMSYVENLEPFDRWHLEKYGFILECNKMVYESRRNAFEEWVNKESELQLLKHES